MPGRETPLPEKKGTPPRSASIAGNARIRPLRSGEARPGEGGAVAGEGAGVVGGGELATGKVQGRERTGRE